MRSRGFTLIEMMVAIAIGAVTVAVAAEVAGFLVRSAASGRQQTDMSQRHKLINVQLRQDIQTAGTGSSGAIGVNVSDAGLGGPPLMQPTQFGGYASMPAVRVADNLGGSIAGIPVAPGSDALMLVVPNPGTMGRTVGLVAANQAVLPMGPPFDPINFANCDWIYIVDHNTPSGAGRVQFARLGGVGAGNVTLGSQTIFAVQNNSEVMCARLSTYWVSDDDGDGFGNWLRRTDFTNAPTPVSINGSGVVVDSAGTAANADRIVPGVLDLQIATAFSSEAFRVNSGIPPPTALEHWAFTANGQPADGLPHAGIDPMGHQIWFEARMLEVHILTRKLRAIDNKVHTRDVFRALNAPPWGQQLSAGVVTEDLITTESLTNLRYYDMGKPRDTIAEPM